MSFGEAIQTQELTASGRISYEGRECDFCKQKFPYFKLKYFHEYESWLCKSCIPKFKQEMQQRTKRFEQIKTLRGFRK